MGLFTNFWGGMSLQPIVHVLFVCEATFLPSYQAMRRQIIAPATRRLNDSTVNGGGTARKWWSCGGITGGCPGQEVRIISQWVISPQGIALL